MVTSLPADRFFIEMLQDGGSDEMAVDGSSTPVDFEYTVPASQEVLLSRAAVFIQDAGPSPTEFGGIAALTNGLLIQVRDGADQLVKQFGEPIQDNTDFVLLAGTDVVYELTTGVDSVSVRWTFSRTSGGDLLQLREGETFRVRVQDDLTGLTSMRWALQGQFVL